MELRLQPDDALLVLGEVFDTIAEDGTSKVPEYEDCLYLCGYVPDLMGCFILHKRNSITVECHVQVLPKYRKEFAEEFGRKVIEWTWKNTDARKIVAQIPFLYPNVKDFALRMGFEVEGVNKLSYRKNGSIHDQWHLGIIR